jgi:hypothetical protein
VVIRWQGYEPRVYCIVMGHDVTKGGGPPNIIALYTRDDLPGIVEVWFRKLFREPTDRADSEPGWEG